MGQAADHFEVALPFCRKSFRPELAWTCCDYADTLLQRNESSDREKAASLLDTFKIAPFSTLVAVLKNISREQFKEILENTVSRTVDGDAGGGSERNSQRAYPASNRYPSRRGGSSCCLAGLVRCP